MASIEQLELSNKSPIRPARETVRNDKTREGHSKFRSAFSRVNWRVLVAGYLSSICLFGISRSVPSYAWVTALGSEYSWQTNSDDYVWQFSALVIFLILNPVMIPLVHLEVHSRVGSTISYELIVPGYYSLLVSTGWWIALGIVFRRTDAGVATIRAARIRRWRQFVSRRNRLWRQFVSSRKIQTLFAGRVAILMGFSFFTLASISFRWGIPSHAVEGRSFPCGEVDSIRAGMSMEEVSNRLGPPLRKTQSNEKAIWIYSERLEWGWERRLWGIIVVSRWTRSWGCDGEVQFVNDKVTAVRAMPEMSFG